MILVPIESAYSTSY